MSEITRRWLANQRQFGENPKIDAFLDEVLQVCEKHGFLISHEDHHGAFEILDNIPKNKEMCISWLKEASDYTNLKEGT